MTVPKTTLVRKGSSTLHYQATGGAHEALFRAAVAMSHGATWSERFAGPARGDIRRNEAEMNVGDAMKVGVIGSGLAGLAAHVRLAARGHRVEVLRRTSGWEARRRSLRAKAFASIWGPTILIQPSVLRKVFEEGRAKARRLHPDGAAGSAVGAASLKTAAASICATTPRRWRRTLEAIWPKMGAGYLKFLEQSEQLHSISDRFFFWRSIAACATLWM